MNKEFIKALKEVEKEKGISQEVLLEAIEQALLSSYKKTFNTTTNVRVEIDRNTGAVRVLARKMAVDEIIDERLEMLLDEARKIKPDIQLYESFDVEVTPRNFGRIAAQTAKTVVMQRIKEAEHAVVYETFAGREDEMVTGKIQGQDSSNLYVLIDQTEAVLPLSELMPKDRFKLGDMVTAYLAGVETSSKGTTIYLSRTHPGFLKKLFEHKIPDVAEGIVKIKAIAREAGQRTKVAVMATRDDVDPVAACVGVKGQTIQLVTSELQGEKIDIIKWSDRPDEFIANALAPSKVLEVKIFEDEDEDEPIARVIVPDDQLTLAIGAKGQNARLAAKLTGHKIDLYSEEKAFKLFNRPRTHVET
jgi:N utilization substance protein A